MPNKRKKGRDQVNAWVPAELKQALRKISESEGVPLSDVVSRILKEQIERHEKGKK